MSLKAVAINDASITPSNCIHALPGDVITSEIEISGWGDQLGLVRGYQARINGVAGVASGLKGTILPVGWDAPLSPDFCGQCPFGFTCPPPVVCPPEFPVCQGQDIGGICVGPAHHPEQGAFITTTRPEFILIGFTLFGGVGTPRLNYIYGMVAAQSDGRFDDGAAYYGGTLKLVASSDACGTFTFGLIEDRSPRADGCLLLDQTPEGNFIVPDTQPLTVSICTDDGIYCNGQESCDAVNGCVVTPVNCDDGVACTVDTCNETAHGCDHTPSDALCDDGDSCTTDTCTANGCVHQNICGSCCDQRDGLCTDGVLASNCACGQCQWTQGASCTNVDCHALFVAIPTVSSWGATILVLTLLAGAKICFARRREDVAGQ